MYLSAVTPSFVPVHKGRECVCVCVRAHLCVFTCIAVLWLLKYIQIATLISV